MSHFTVGQRSWFLPAIRGPTSSGRNPATCERGIFEGFRDPEVASLPFDRIIERVIDGLAADHGANPGFRLLFCGKMTVGQLADPADELHEEIARGTEGLLLGSLPGLGPSKAGLVATIVVDLARALMMTASTCDPADRPAALDESKAVLGRCPGPLASRSPIGSRP